MRGNLLENAGSCTLDDNFYLIEAPVGSGKTFASTKLALRLAKKYNLNNIFAVMPFINITSQVAKVWRDNLYLASDIDPDENQNNLSHPGEQSVAEHHCLAVYDDLIAQMTGKLWKAPLTCVTAVQFYQTIFGNHPFTLRKLHNLSGSVIILDEYDNSIPLHMWSAVCSVLVELTEKWGCKVIFCSGTPIKPWKSPVFVTNIEPKTVVSNKLMQEFVNYERHRAPVI